MDNWLVGAIALTLWFGSTVLYLRREIVNWFLQRLKARKALAEARAKYQAQMAAQSKQNPPS